MASTTEAGGSGSPRKGNNVNLPTAYLLYCVGGFFGLHHAYLNRPQQALGWFASAGLCGYGLLRDLFHLPDYVALARDDRARDVEARVRAATVEARDGVPRLSFARIALMWLFGTYFGVVASCLVDLPTEDDPPGSGGPRWTAATYGILKTLGTVAGVWLVGNMGEETILTSPGGSGALEFARLAAWCLASFALTRLPVLGGIIYASRHRRYRPSMFPTATTGTGASPPSAARRIGRHLLACATYTALLAVAAYNHGHVRVHGGRRIYLHDALRNAYRSEFWKEFEWAEFREGLGGGGREGGEYLKKMFDVQGERGARRVLGVARDAPHAEVRGAYKKLALRYHPDKIGSEATEWEVEETKGKFVMVQEAYEILNDIEQARKKKGAAEAEAEAEAESQQYHRGGGGRSAHRQYRGQRPQRDEM